MALCKSERSTESKREVLLLGDPVRYEVSAAVTRGELVQLRPDIEVMF